MFKIFRRITPLYFFIDFFLIALTFSIVYIFNSNIVRAGSLLYHLPNIKEYIFIFSLWAIFIMVSFSKKGLYATDRSLTIPKEVSRVVVSILSTAILIAGVIFFAKYKFFSRRIFFQSFSVLCLVLSGWRVSKRLIVRKLIAGGFKNLNVLIVGAGKVGMVIFEEIKRNPSLGLKVVGFLDDVKSDPIGGLKVIGDLDSFTAIAKKYFIDEVIVSIPSERRAVSELIIQARKMRLALKVIPESFQEPLPVLGISYLGIIPLLTYKEQRHHPTEFFLKRLFDFFVSFVLLVILSPLFLVLIAMIKRDSPGPVLYIQKRSGFKGRIFNFYKFRSMVKDADSLKESLADKNESQGRVIFKIKKDPRTTRIGRFLRKYSFDELPQIVNVLKGDMSLVGPRPFPVAESQRMNGEHLQRLAVRPGITGLAQVKGRSDLSFYRWAKWDLWYVNNWSFGLDFYILWQTLPVVLKAKGAY